jgi:hypothetical protein
MADKRSIPEPDSTLDPEDVNSPPSSATTDANDEVPVPIAMSPAEVDERAQAVEALGGGTIPLASDERRAES